MEPNITGEIIQEDTNVDVIVEHHNKHLLVFFKSRDARAWFVRTVVRDVNIIDGKLLVPLEYEDVFDFMMMDEDFEILDKFIEDEK
jgi:hypothetical protein